MNRYLEQLVTDPTPEFPPPLGTGIPGLDLVLGGGWPPVGSYLLQGEPGAGKTTVSLQFLLQGMAVGERCAFVSLSESEAEIRRDAHSHGWKLDGIEIVDLSATQAALTAESDYSVFSPDEVELNGVMERIRDAVERIRPHRLVLDPATGIRLLSGHASRYRQQMLGLKDFFQEHGVTALILSNAGSNEDAYLETAVRGVLRLRQTPWGIRALPAIPGDSEAARCGLPGRRASVPN